ncbi:MAG: hypothetical protein FWD69_15400 [Polyangiaceae bacterium]|nr:hypothetical protein [Polyangiaceae bacterium]
MRSAYAEVLSDPDLVEPTADYFPDAFAVDPKGIAGLVQRMVTYVPLSSDLGIDVVFVESEGASAGSCGGCCSPNEGSKKVASMAGAAETEDGYAVILDVGSVSDPTLLTTAIARALGRIVLYEAGEHVDPRIEGALAELTAVACGLGVLVLNGSCIYKKACSGMRQHQGTFLSTEEIALAVALFICATHKKPSSVRKHLPVTQKEAFDAALAWVDGQPRLLRALIESPETLTDGLFDLEEKKGLFARLFASKSAGADDTPSAESFSVQPKTRTEEERRRLAEAKALVDEALDE